MEAPAMPNTRKNKKQEGGKKKGGKKTRKLSPALKEWNRKVMTLYRDMKKSNPNTKLKDAMKAAKKLK